MLGACKSKDKGETAKSEVQVSSKSITTKSLSAKSFEDVLEVGSRKVSKADSKQALSDMGLGKASDIKWAAKSEKNGRHIYNSVSLEGDDGETINIETLTVTGPHMVDGDPSFDRLDIEGLSVTGDDATAKIARLSMAHPSPKIGAGIMKSLESIEDVRELDDLNLAKDERAFGAMLMENMSVTADDANIDVATIGWAEDQDTGKGTFLLKGLNVDSEKNGPAANISLNSIAATGVNVKYFRSLSELNSGASNPIMGLNPYASQFDSFSLKDFKLSADTLSIVTDGYESVSSQKGSVTTSEQNLKPITIKFTEEPTSRDVMQFYQSLQAVGFDELVLSGASSTVMNEKTDTVSVEDAWFKLDDGFTLRYDYEGTGATAMLNGLRHSDGEELTQSELNAVLDKVTLNSLNLKLTDQSIVEKIISNMSQQQGVSPKLVRLQAKAGLGALTFMAKNDGQAEFLGDLSSSLGNFLDDGGTLNISLNPQTPVSASFFKDMNPQDIDPAQLGVSVSHSQ